MNTEIFRIVFFNLLADKPLIGIAIVVMHLHQQASNRGNLDADSYSRLLKRDLRDLPL
jgi:hypothetical protein